MEVKVKNNIFSALVVVNSPIVNSTFVTNCTNEDFIKLHIEEMLMDKLADKCANAVARGALSMPQVLVCAPSTVDKVLEDTTTTIIKSDFDVFNALISACNEAFTRKDATAIDTFESQYGELPKEIRANIDSIINS